MIPIMAGVKGVFKMFSGGGKNSTLAMETARDGLDKMFLTDEEELDYKERSEERAVKKDELKFKIAEKILEGENDKRSIARRELANKLLNSYLTLLLGSAILGCFDQTDKAKHLYELSKEIRDWVGMVVGFYFLYYGAQSMIKTYKEKDKDNG